MELRFYINNALVESPINWDEIDVNIEYDPVNQITTISHNSDMRWEGDVYSLLFNEVENGDVCQQFDFELKGVIDNDLFSIFTGKIDITKCSFEERIRVVSVPIVDDSFGAKIENNKGAKVGLDSVQSKNGEAISCVTSQLQVFNSSTGSYISELRRCYSVYDAFKFLVDWMSDGTIGFKSDFFDTSLANDGAFDRLLSGIDLRTANEVSAPKFSFQELFDLMRRVRNVAMGFKYIDDVPTVVIEHIDFFRSNTDTFTLLDVNETELSFEQNILYTTIKVGSDIVKPNDCTSTCNASNNISYLGFETEFYSLSGECTNESELTITVDDPFIVDTNKIQEAVEFQSETNDDKTFLIHRNPSIPQQADQSDPLGIGENWYNEAYTNKQILLRYQDYVTGTLSLYSLNSGVNLFLYEGNTTSGKLLPLQAPSYSPVPVTAGNGFPLNNLIYDPQNRIDTITERFTPVDEGTYLFEVGVNVDEFPSSPPAVTLFFYLQIEQYDSSNTLINTYQSDLREYFSSAPPNFEVWTSDWITMDSGDYAVFTISYAQNINPAVTQGEFIFGTVVTEDNYFQCIGSRALIQDQQVNGGQKRQLAVTRFEHPIGIQDFRSFYEDTTQGIRVTSLDIDRTGYVNSFEYNFSKGQSEISIVSNG